MGKRMAVWPVSNALMMRSPDLSDPAPSLSSVSSTSSVGGAYVQMHIALSLLECRERSNLRAGRAAATQCEDLPAHSRIQEHAMQTAQGCNVGQNDDDACLRGNRT